MCYWKTHLLLEMRVPLFEEDMIAHIGEMIRDLERNGISITSLIRKEQKEYLHIKKISQ